MNIKFKNLRKSKIIRIALLILIFISLINCSSVSIVRAEDQRSSASHDINNNQDIKSFMDSYFNSNMDKYSVPGASVVVVKDNKEIFKSGYGYSNLESNIPVDPDKTLFPACSVSKLFTATAIIKLYEEGKIDLDKDVNYYISPYKVINNYKEKVTCRNLLTHSSGLDEESELNVSTTDYNSIKPQEYYFKNHPLKTINKPNTICRYSNNGYNLLGYIVEKVSNMHYEDYIESEILKPLNMDDTLIRDKNTDTAIGYEYDNTKYTVAPFSYQYTSGSSGIIATAKDMEKFLIANLNTNNTILSSKSISMMHDKQFSNSEYLPGMGFGFIRSYRNNQEILKHEGALPGYTTTLFLIPKQNLGVYVATNSLSGLPFDFEDAFLDYFYPYDNDDFNNAKKDSSKDYSAYEGTYRSYDGISKTNIMKIGSLFDSDMTIKDNKDGTLDLNECTQSKEEITTTLVESDKEGVFIREDGKGYFGFRQDENGKVTYAFNDVSINSYEKLKFYEQSEFIICILCLSLLIFIINLIVSIKSFIKRKYVQESKKIRLLNPLNIILELSGMLGLVSTIIMTIWMCLNSNFSLQYLLYLSLTLLNLCAIISIFCFVLFMFTLYSSDTSIKSKVYYAFLNAANISFVWILYYFNLLGYKLY